MDEQTVQDKLSVSTEHDHAIDSTVCAMPNLSVNNSIVDLYLVAYEKSTRETENPFTHYLLLHSANGEVT